LGALKKPIDEQVANHFLVYRDGTEFERTTLEKDIGSILSRMLARRLVRLRKIILVLLAAAESDSGIDIRSALFPTAASL
jgi:hypothetical protein